MIIAKIGNQTFEYQTDWEQYFKPFREGIIGLDETFESPYGEQKIIYTDWIASGRLFGPIEDRMRSVFGPRMANTHSESNYTGQTMTLAYEEAKRIIKHHVNASDEEVIMLEGSGMTSVMAKFQRILGLKGPEQWQAQMRLAENERPVVFVSHMEHHSNQTSWEETIADVVIVPPAPGGGMDLRTLERLLDLYKDRPLKIGAFTACSNVTGIRTPYSKLARIMHQHGGICVIDFAASAPYEDMNMHPDDPEERLDGLFFSTHKFLGGPGASGVGIFNSQLYHNRVPDEPGGGTVDWTNPWGVHLYKKDIETREDSGTPGILQGIRAALAIKLKEKMGTDQMAKREKELLDIVLPNLKQMKSIRVLDGDVWDRLGMVSFISEDIHYNLIVKLLNDRFGYQVRGGCSCAGTYAHYLLHINQEESEHIEAQLEKDDQSEKPGWVRFSIHPTMTNQEAYGFLHAMKQIITHVDEWEKDYLYDPVSNDYFYIHHERADYNELFEL